MVNRMQTKIEDLVREQINTFENINAARQQSYLDVHTQTNKGHENSRQLTCRPILNLVWSKQPFAHPTAFEPRPSRPINPLSRDETRNSVCKVCIVWHWFGHPLPSMDSATACQCPGRPGPQYASIVCSEAERARHEDGQEMRSSDRSLRSILSILASSPSLHLTLIRRFSTSCCAVGIRVSLAVHAPGPE